MLNKKELEIQIENLLIGSDKFLVDLKLSTSNVIQVFLDGDKGVTIDDCVEFSRLLEENIDREKEDFELQVSSAGIDAPLRNIRQFIKNIGRSIMLRTSDGIELKGIIRSAGNNEIVVENTFTQKKPQSKKKEEITEQVKLEIQNILSAKIIISF
jgi:ribosome maturation factor RimP